ncbi:integrase arm-type DNA-binding domain-containing protein [Variovorax sp. J2P1-59]|uniref:tyrosine-type recombinase/integrase n=1 Tax=Variovorax flavidus TaxID=3053501 RepID=UPI002576297D|nr:integrase arm-type DNA-binding domain-containing protein [Variovorax sp. J2P1-59]MDM0072791.1 integrase arm-type DNA-binding domain-containing protein [Variovorax sp. J2P1-59]
MGAYKGALSPKSSKLLPKTSGAFPKPDMPKTVTPLTVQDCKNAAPGSKAFDGGGLYLEVARSGSRYWYLKYRHNGAERRMGIGPFPAIALPAARTARDEAKAHLRAGRDPQQQQRVVVASNQTAAANTYEAIARELHQLNPLTWQDAHREKWLAMQERHLFARIGSLPVTQITAPILLAPLRVVEQQGKHETATSLRQYASQTLRYAVQTGRAERDVSIDLRGAIRAPIQRSYGAVTDVEKLPELIRAVHAYHGRSITREALWLSALLFQRPGNLRGLQWDWVSFSKHVIVIPSAEMKRTLRAKVQGKPHEVPLSSQAVDCLQRLKNLSGGGKYVFPSERTGERPMSDGTVNSALRRLGYSKEEMTAHGFRAMARTVLAEHHDIPESVLEELLGHGKPGPLGSAYDRTTWTRQRKEAMQAWGDFLDGFVTMPAKKATAKVVRLAGRAA